MLRDGTLYRDLRPDHLPSSTPLAHAQQLAKKIARLGFTCTLMPQPPESHPSPAHKGAGTFCDARFGDSGY